MDDAQGFLAAAWQAAMQAEACGQWQQAAAGFLACAGQPGRAAAAHFRAGVCLEHAGDWPGADAHYAMTIEHACGDDEPLRLDALFRRAWMALGAQDHAQAAVLLAELLARAAEHGIDGPLVENASYWYAACLEMDGQPLAAAARYQSIVESGRPDLWPEAAYRRLQCLSQVGDLDGALAAADALLQPAAPATDAERLQALQRLAAGEQAQIRLARASA